MRRSEFGLPEDMNGGGESANRGGVYRISEVEEKIGAGLIEEVIQVAEGELELVGKMAESKA